MEKSENEKQILETLVEDETKAWSMALRGKLFMERMIDARKAGLSEKIVEFFKERADECMEEKGDEYDRQMKIVSEMVNDLIVSSMVGIGGGSLSLDINGHNWDHEITSKGEVMYKGEDAQQIFMKISDEVKNRVDNNPNYGISTYDTVHTPEEANSQHDMRQNISVHYNVGFFERRDAVG